MKGRALSFTAILVLVLTAIGPGAAIAQDDPMAGVSVEALGSMPAAGAEDRALNFLRITLEPGAHIDPHSHPGSVIVVVDTGRFTTEFTQGEGTVTRAGMEGRTIGVGEPRVLEPGDSLAYDGTAAHTMANEGEEPLVLLVAALLDPDEEGFLFHE